MAPFTVVLVIFICLQVFSIVSSILLWLKKSKWWAVVNFCAVVTTIFMVIFFAIYAFGKHPDTSGISVGTYALTALYLLVAIIPQMLIPALIYFTYKQEKRIKVAILCLVFLIIAVTIFIVGVSLYGDIYSRYDDEPHIWGLF